MLSIFIRLSVRSKALRSIIVSPFNKPYCMRCPTESLSDSISTLVISCDEQLNVENNSIIYVYKCFISFDFERMIIFSWK